LQKDKIALAIKETRDSPLDSNLEAILPGVHQRLVANQRKVLSLQNFVEEGFSTLGTKGTEAFKRQEEAMKERDQKTGEAYLSLTQGLMEEGDSSLVRAFRRDQAIAEQTEQTVNSNSTTNSVLMTRPHSLVMRHKSIYTIYYEWYGLK
jgi:hypothetical protein